MKKSEKLREVAEVIAALDLKFPFSEIVDHLSEELSALHELPLPVVYKGSDTSGASFAECIADFLPQSGLFGNLCRKVLSGQRCQLERTLGQTACRTSKSRRIGLATAAVGDVVFAA